MKQKRFNFGHTKTIKAEEWVSIVSGDPERYPSPLMQRMAAMALHRAGKPHQSEHCPLCQRNGGNV